MLNEQYRTGVAEAAPAAAPGTVVHVAQESLAAALAVAADLGERGTQLAVGARGAFADGLSVAFYSSVGILLLVAALLAVMVPGRTVRTDAEAVAAQPGAEKADADPRRTSSLSP